jgi:prepilin-type N-terminal cleavage/methylation domain-containing protein
VRTVAAIRSIPRAGFTLLEVLVSSAVLAIVLAIMFSALSTSMSLWRNTDNKIVADREARAVEMMMARDLANVVIPASTNLWPRIESPRRSSIQFLKFLTLAPSAAQSAGGAELGDVCYVEYAVLPSTNGPGLEMRRLFLPSGQTYSNVIRPNSFPVSTENNPAFQSLGLHILPTNSWAVRGLGQWSIDPRETVFNTNFFLIGTNMLRFDGAPGNYPVAIEVNFAVADPDSLANTNVIANPNFVLRNAGLYSFRIPLPKPPNAP